MTNFQYTFLQQVQQLMQDTYETKLTEEELIFVLPDLGLHKNSVKAELVFYEEDCGLPDRNTGVLQLYMTVCKYQEAEETAVGQRLLELNSFVMLGSFNLYQPLHQIYYRYSLPLTDLESPGALETLFTALGKLSSILDSVYNYLTLIGSQVSAITLDEYLQEIEELQTILEEDPDFLEHLEEEV